MTINQLNLENKKYKEPCMQSQYSGNGFEPLVHGETFCSCCSLWIAEATHAKPNSNLQLEELILLHLHVVLASVQCILVKVRCFFFLVFWFGSQFSLIRRKTHLYFLYMNKVSIMSPSLSKTIMCLYIYMIRN